MTGPAVPGDDELREALAEAADRWDRTASPDVGWHVGLLDALLPVVRRWAEQRAAEEATQALTDLAQRFRDLGQVGAYCIVRARIEARADALTRAVTS